MAAHFPPKLCLAHTPTPLQKPERLARAMGLDLWVKRDDMTGGAEAGNKIRKLEFLLADARSLGADIVITCGGLQSNHARATALLAASLGMRALLFLRTTEDGDRDPARAPLTGNTLLDKLCSAEIRLITPAMYRERSRIMAEAAAELRALGATPYVIPEGGSSGLGALGYVEAMGEVRRQLDQAQMPHVPFDVIVHACGSGGTAAGVALGASLFDIAPEVRPMAVCDDAATFQALITRIIEDARAIAPSLPAPARVLVDDRAKGPAYAVSTPEQRLRIVEAARLSGLVFDPVYTGKALSGLWDLAQNELKGARVLLLHTGGLPGLLAQGSAFSGEL